MPAGPAAHPAPRTRRPPGHLCPFKGEDPPPPRPRLPGDARPRPYTDDIIPAFRLAVRPIRHSVHAPSPPPRPASGPLASPGARDPLASPAGAHPRLSALIGEARRVSPRQGGEGRALPRLRGAGRRWRGRVSDSGQARSRGAAAAPPGTSGVGARWSRDQVSPKLQLGPEPRSDLCRRGQRKGGGGRGPARRDPPRCGSRAAARTSSQRRPLVRGEEGGGSARPCRCPSRCPPSSGGGEAVARRGWTAPLRGAPARPEGPPAAGARPLPPKAPRRFPLGPVSPVPRSSLSSRSPPERGSAQLPVSWAPRL